MQTIVQVPRHPLCSLTESMLQEGCYTTLAVALNVAMEADPIAQFLYRETWGYDWEPLPLGSTPHTPSTNIDSPSTRAKTFSTRK